MYALVIHLSIAATSPFTVDWKSMPPMAISYSTMESEAALLRLDYFNTLDPVPSSNAIDYVHAFDDLPEHRVTTVEMWLRRVGYEKLTAAGVFARQSHSYGARLVSSKIDLIANL